RAACAERPCCPGAADRGAVPAAEGRTLDAVLPSRTCKCGRPGGDAAHGRAVSGAAVLWIAPHGGGVTARWLVGEPQTGQAADAGDGSGGNLSETQHQPGPSRPQGVSLPVARLDDRTAESGVVCGYHLYPDGEGVRVSGGGHGLVQPTGPGVAI